MTTTKIPQETRTIRMDPDLRKALEEILEPYSGEELELAQAAILAVRKAGRPGNFRELIAMYTSAILLAVDPA